jgi:hypothetical protein
MRENQRDNDTDRYELEAQSRQVAGAAGRIPRARSPSIKTAYPSAFSQSKPLSRIGRTYDPHRTELDREFHASTSNTLGEAKQSSERPPPASAGARLSLAWSGGVLTTESIAPSGVLSRARHVFRLGDCRGSPRVDSRSSRARAVSAVRKPSGLRVSEHRRDEQLKAPFPLPNPLSAQHRDVYATAMPNDEFA